MYSSNNTMKCLTRKRLTRKGLTMKNRTMNNQTAGTLYLANPLGFSMLTTPILKSLVTRLSKKFTVIEPFVESTDLGEQIVELQERLHNPSTTDSFSSIYQRLTSLNDQIGARNMQHIKASAIILAILDGVDVDSGVAAEIGFAFGLGKRIYGLRGDFRPSGDNYGTSINLQVAYFINASGGQIFQSMDELDRWIAQYP